MKKECNTVSFKNQVIYVGIDIHKNSWQVSIRHCRHQLANFSMNPDALKLAEHLRRNYPEAEYRSVYEAGFCGFEIHRSLCGLGILNIVINPADVPTSGKERANKNDGLDSRKLARELENGSLVRSWSRNFLRSAGFSRSRSVHLHRSRKPSLMP